jgi:signal transduction histidine kinase
VRGLGAGPLQRYLVVGGVAMRVRVVPARHGDAMWTVAVGIDSGQAEDAIDDVQRALAVTGPLLLVAVGLGAWFVSGSALRPVTRLRRDAAALGSHDVAGRLTVPRTRDEIAELATTFNALLDRLHRSLRRQRDLVADAGHELRTPLAVLRTELELADRPGRSGEELADAVAHARVEVERLSRLADDMLFLAHADDGTLRLQRERVDCCELLRTATRALRATAAQAGVRLVVRCTEPLVAWADRAVLRRALDNLLANALRACDGGGVVVVSAEPEAAAEGDPDGDLIVITVADDGPGFDELLLTRAFDRFTTGASSRGSGSGLGLAITAEIAHAHGGTAIARNAEAGGAEVSLRIPRAGS